jgi:cytoskeletal protein RodZ
VSIGGTLARGRQEAGLTITAVSQRTCIRETIIRGIEHDDFSGCGGDFYARGHVRSIAGVLGVDPRPLIDEYDATVGSPAVISAAEVFQPVVPVKLRERRKPNWTVALAIAVVLAGGLVGYQYFAGRSPAAAPRQAADRQAKVTAKSGAQDHARASASSPAQSGLSAGHPASHVPRKLDIRLTAARDCFVQLTSATGQIIYSGVVVAGRSARWVEGRAITMTIADPSAVRLRVNGKNPVPPGAVRTMTLSLRPGHLAR